jgi:hypothetical protein
VVEYRATCVCCRDVLQGFWCVLTACLFGCWHSRYRACIWLVVQVH